MNIIIAIIILIGMKMISKWDDSKTTSTIANEDQLYHEDLIN